MQDEKENVGFDGHSNEHSYVYDRFCRSVEDRSRTK